MIHPTAVVFSSALLQLVPKAEIVDVACHQWGIFLDVRQVPNDETLLKHLIERFAQVKRANTPLKLMHMTPSNASQLLLHIHQPLRAQAAARCKDTLITLLRCESGYCDLSSEAAIESSNEAWEIALVMAQPTKHFLRLHLACAPHSQALKASVKSYRHALANNWQMRSQALELMEQSHLSWNQRGALFRTQLQQWIKNRYRQLGIPEYAPLTREYTPVAGFHFETRKGFGVDLLHTDSIGDVGTEELPAKDFDKRVLSLLQFIHKTANLLAIKQSLLVRCPRGGSKNPQRECGARLVKTVKRAEIDFRHEHTAELPAIEWFFEDTFGRSWLGAWLRVEIVDSNTYRVHWSFCHSVDRLAALILEHNSHLALFLEPQEVWLLPAHKTHHELAQSWLKQLNEIYTRVAILPASDALHDRLKRAHALSIPFILVLDENTMETGSAAQIVKDCKEKRITLCELIQEVMEMRRIVESQ